MTIRIENGKAILPVDQEQARILGHGVLAQLRVPQLEEELRQARARIAELEKEIPELRAESDRLAALINAKPKPAKKHSR